MNDVKYVPILKLKPGEVTAMTSLTNDQKQSILPVFEVVFSGPRKDAREKGRDARLESIIDKFRTQKLPELPGWLMDARGVYSFIIDFTLIFVDEVKADALKYLLKQCSDNQQRVIVSINVADTEEYKKLAYALIRQYGFGLCVRVSRPDLIDVEKLESSLQNISIQSGIPPTQTVLLADIREEQDDQKYSLYFETLQKLPSLNSWKTVIFANGTFPESMGGFKAGKEHDASRSDWIRYNAAIIKKGIRRVPVFADYSARYPIYDVEAEKHSPSPTIKYTTESNWRLMKGGDYDYGNYFIYSRALIDMGPYYGINHCYGDQFLKEKADMFEGYISKRAAAGGKIKADKVGKSEEWIAMSISHHTVVTLDQLAN